ncbi:tyrosine-type recombinase/integrase [Micromonospora sp. SD19]
MPASGKRRSPTQCLQRPCHRQTIAGRMVALPRFAVGMIMARKLVAADNPHDAIFASRRGTCLSPNNVRRQWREARADTDLAWVTPHTFRKTVATLIKKRPTRKAPRHSSDTPARRSPPRTTSPNPPKPRTSRTSSSDSAPTAGAAPHPHCPTMRRDDEPGSRPR